MWWVWPPSQINWAIVFFLDHINDSLHGHTLSNLASTFSMPASWQTLHHFQRQFSSEVCAFTLHSLPHLLPTPALPKSRPQPVPVCNRSLLILFLHSDALSLPLFLWKPYSPPKVQLKVQFYHKDLSDFFRLGSVNFGTTDILGQISLYRDEVALFCIIGSSWPSLTRCLFPPKCDCPKCLQILPLSRVREQLPINTNHCFRTGMRKLWPLLIFPEVYLRHSYVQLGTQYLWRFPVAQGQAAA